MSETVRIFRVVFYDEETGEFCQCRGGFWKTCPLRAANDLPCKESVVSITPVDRSDVDNSADPITSLDSKLKNLNDKLKALHKKGII